MTPTRLRSGLLASLCLCASVTATAENWPQFRGADRSGIVTEKNLAAAWPEGGPKELWRASTGLGYASPVAHEGRVYMFYLDVDKSQDVLEAFDAATGKSLWRQAYDKGWTADYKGTRCSPVIHNGRVYTYGGNSQLVCRNLADGKQLWVVNVLQETGGGNKTWGMSSNPLIDGDRIFVQGGEGGNAAVAVNLADGSFAWKSEAKDGGYAPPVLVTATDGKKHLVCFAHDRLIGMDPQTGKTLWQTDEPWETQYNINATMPVVSGSRVFVSCAYQNGHSTMYEVGPAGAKKVWSDRTITARFQPPILDNGHLYVNSEGTLKCVRWDDGKVLWSSNDNNLLKMGGSIVRVGGDKLICQSDNGGLSLVKATPAGVQKITTLKRFVDGDQVWSTPLVYQGRLYVKGKEDLVAYDIRGK
jgi:outer membrane protein assembly factor BamB